MNKRLSILVVCWFVLTPLLAQGEIDEQVRLLFRDESSFGAFLNSSGFGINYRYGFWRNARTQFILEGNLDYVKHPKEVKIQVPFSYSTRRYVYGKENLFWELKGLAGWQKELFRKIDKTGISVRLFYGGGISAGFLKPIYYEVYTITPFGEAINPEYKKFSLGLFHQENIGGRGPFFMGFNELKVVPGLAGKMGLSFEYSERDAILHALEAGIGLTVYPKKIPIMATEQNNFLFLSLSVGYRFGNIIDISESARTKPWKERIKERREARKAAGPAMPFPIY